MQQAINTSSAREPGLDARALAALAKTRNFSTDSVRLLLRTREVLAMGLVLGQWREARDPVSGAFAEHCHAEIKEAEAHNVLRINRGRFLRIPPKQRVRYTPEERFAIVVHVRTYCLTFEQAGEAFTVDPHTISRWVHEATREPDKTTVGSLLKATPPVRSFDNVTRQLVALLGSLGIDIGCKTISQMLGRAKIKLSRETVRRWRKKPQPLAPAPTPPSKDEPVKPLAVRAKEPNHVWMTDITNLPTLFRIWIFKLVVVLDVYSRFPLAFRVFSKEPTSEEIAALVQTAVDKFGKPKHFVSDRGSQFTGQAFRAKLRALGTLHRFGAIGQSGSIAIIERFWRTLKEMLHLRTWPPLSRQHLEDKLALALPHYSYARPHQNLKGATPAEIYFRLTPAITDAVSPPRANSRDPATPLELPFVIAYSDAERRLPFLIPSKLAA